MVHATSDGWGYPESDEKWVFKGKLNKVFLHFFAMTHTWWFFKVSQCLQSAPLWKIIKDGKILAKNEKQSLDSTCLKKTNFSTVLPKPETQVFGEPDPSLHTTAWLTNNILKVCALPFWFSLHSGFGLELFFKKRGGFFFSGCSALKTFLKVSTLELLFKNFENRNGSEKIKGLICCLLNYGTGLLEFPKVFDDPTLELPI